MSEIKIISWLWSQPGGRTKYSSNHVNIWAAMVRRNLTLPHKLACVTDMPDGIDPTIEIIQPPGEFENLRIPTWKDGRPSCFRRLVMFRPDAADLFGNRFVSMDLDCVVIDSLDPLFDRNDEIVLFKGSQAYQPYNGSMLMMTAGCRPHVYTRLTPERAAEAGRAYVGSDQSWLCYSLGPHEEVWDERHGVWRYGGNYLRSGEKPRLLFFPGKEKPWSSSVKDHYTRAHYRVNMREPMPESMIELTPERSTLLNRLGRRRGVIVRNRLQRV